MAFTVADSRQRRPEITGSSSFKSPQSSRPGCSEDFLSVSNNLVTRDATGAAPSISLFNFERTATAAMASVVIRTSALEELPFQLTTTANPGGISLNITIPYPPG